MRKYDDEFKQNAVRKILDGQSVASVSREIGVAESLLFSGVSNAEREVLELRKHISYPLNDNSSKEIRDNILIV